MTKQDAYATGKDRGQGIGSYIEIYDDYDKYISACYESEENSRQYSDFSFIAVELNRDADRAEYLWEAYENGLADGFAEQWARRPVDMRQDDIH